MVYGDFPPNTDHFTLAENKRLKAELAAAQGNADDNYKKLMECRTELAAERERVRELTEEMQERRDEFAAYRIDVNDRITKLREALEDRDAIAAFRDELRAELAAERDELKFERHNHGEWMKIFDARTAERDKLREALERAVVRIKSLQGHDIIDPAIRAVLEETK